MNNPGGVRNRQCFGDLPPQGGHRCRRRTGVQDFAQGPAFHHLHHHVAAGIASADVVNRDDIRMIERGSRARFTLEPPHALGVQAVAVSKQLDGYISFQPLVLGEINFAHTAGPYRRQNLVATDNARR